MATKNSPTRNCKIERVDNLRTDWNEIYERYNHEIAPEDVPEGWESVREISLKVGRSERSVRKTMVKAIEDGFVECKKFRVKSLSGSLSILTRHYRAIEHHDEEDDKNNSTKTSGADKYSGS